MNSCKLAILVAVLCIPVGTPSALADVAPCMTAGPACERSIEVVPGYQVGLYSSFDLTVPNPAVTNAIVIIHGVGRDYAAVFEQLTSLIQAGSLSPNTLIVAPHFLSPDDKPGPGLLYWDPDGWSAGDDSLDGTKTSSYTAIDQVIRQIAGSGNFPNLKGIMITGMSAGGQTTQRYTAGTDVDQEFPKVHFRFMIAAPSSYMYLTDERWVKGTQYQFTVPTNPGCDYDSYRYGMDGMNAYMSRKSHAQIVADYLSRDAAYIVGELDDATVYNPVPPVPYDWKDAMDLDVSCPSEWEGNSRLQRSFIFNQYLNVMFPQNKHVWFSIPGVAHENRVYSDPRAITLMKIGE